MVIGPLLNSVVQPTETKTEKSTAQANCEARGGTWDPVAKVCNLPTKADVLKPSGIDTRQSTKTLTKEQRAAEVEKRRTERVAREREATTAKLQSFLPDVFKPTPEAPEPTPPIREPVVGEQEEQQIDKGTEVDFLPDGTVNYTRAGQTINLTKEEYDVAILGRAGMVTDKVKQAQALQPEAQAEAEGARLAGQVGEFDQLEAEGTDFDIAQGLLQGVADAIPRALSLGGAALAGSQLFGGAAGAAGGTAFPASGVVVTGSGRILQGGAAAARAGVFAGLTPAIAVAGTAAFAGLMATSIISEFKGQRSDNITSQQRVLDEGKQTMQDWATMAATDPVNKALYLKQYNKVSAQIDRAYRNMKRDVQDDVLKFDTALPSLAEFESFYAFGGERDVLNSDMRNSLSQPSTPDYRLLEMQTRRLKQ